MREIEKEPGSETMFEHCGIQSRHFCAQSGEQSGDIGCADIDRFSLMCSFPTLRYAYEASSV